MKKQGNSRKKSKRRKIQELEVQESRKELIKARECTGLRLSWLVFLANISCIVFNLLRR
jgi:hypothetical protein